MHLIRSALLTLVFSTWLGTLAAQKVAVVLSGGGARGLAHIGVLKALEENHIPVDYIAGTSMGAMVAGLYAAGYTPDELENFANSDEFYYAANGLIPDDYIFYFKKKDPNASIITFTIAKDSLWQTKFPIKIIDPVSIDFSLMINLSGANAASKYNYDSLFIPFRCVAADIEKKETVVFSKGNMSQAIRASMSFPFFLPPVNLGQKILCDGGLYNNFPANVVMEDFQPDIIIGSNVSGGPFKIEEDNILSQLRTMVVSATNYDVICQNGILVEPNVRNFDVFDFRNNPEIIDSGYVATKREIQRIRTYVPRTVTKEYLQKKRQTFKSKMPELKVNEIHISGISESQAAYVRKIIKPGKESLSLEKLKVNYYKLVADDNIKKIFPKLIYNESSKMFDLHLDIKRARELIIQAGGNFSSRPISEAFLGFSYNLWKKRSLSIIGNTYFGKLYNYGNLKLRMEIPSAWPFYLEPEGVINQWDYFKSSSIVLEDIRPSYLVITDKKAALNVGFQAGQKGKIVGTGSVVSLVSKYYQTFDFNQNDTADVTRFNGTSTGIFYERNTLNKKMYANEGTYLSVLGRFTEGIEYLEPGSTSKNIKKNSTTRNWIILKMQYLNYFKRKGRVKFGYYVEGLYSTQPLFLNYTSTILMVPGFQPIPDSKTLFLDIYKSPMYVGGGLQGVINVRKSVDLRLEGYVFQPYKEVVNSSGLALYKTGINRRNYMASSALVYHSPIGPVSVSVNYYQRQKNPFSVLLHFGFFIFNKGALE